MLAGGHVVMEHEVIGGHETVTGIGLLTTIPAAFLAVMLAVPAATPVTTPLLTDATAGLLLCHVSVPQDMETLYWSRHEAVNVHVAPGNIAEPQPDTVIVVRTDGASMLNVGHSSPDVWGVGVAH